MMVIERVTPATMEQQAAAVGIELPIEQTGVWADFQSDIPGRKPWGSLLIRDHSNNDEIVAVISLIDMETHGYHYLRSIHGPAWATKPTEQQEQDAVRALMKFVRMHDKKVAFLRIDTWYDHPIEYPVLSTVPYSATVVLDLEGGEDGILSRMKARGRRDVRKALRECPATVADETEQATKDFSDYYKVMVETSQRDGFNPAPMSDYTDMIKALGPDHCRVFAARIDGKVVAWSLVAMHGSTAVYYYASMLSEVRRLHVPDKLLFTVACMLGEQGLAKLDLMGIGNDFAPSLKPLNEFKTKFTKETTEVAAAHDFPIKTVLYKALLMMKDLRAKLRGSKKNITVDDKGNTNKDWKQAGDKREDNNPNRAGKAAKSDNASKTAQTSTTDKADKTAQTSKSDKPAKAAKPDNASNAKADQDAKPAKAIKPAKPAKTTKPAKTDKAASTKAASTGAQQSEPSQAAPAAPAAKANDQQ